MSKGERTEKFGSNLSNFPGREIWKNKTLWAQNLKKIKPRLSKFEKNITPNSLSRNRNLKKIEPENLVFLKGGGNIHNSLVPVSFHNFRTQNRLFRQKKYTMENEQNNFKILKGCMICCCWMIVFRSASRLSLQFSSHKFVMPGKVTLLQRSAVWVLR